MEKEDLSNVAIECGICGSRLFVDDESYQQMVADVKAYTYGHPLYPVCPVCKHVVGV